MRTSVVFVLWFFLVLLEQLTQEVVAGDMVLPMPCQTTDTLYSVPVVTISTHPRPSIIAPLLLEPLASDAPFNSLLHSHKSIAARLASVLQSASSVVPTPRGAAVPVT